MTSPALVPAEVLTRLRDEQSRLFTASASVRVPSKSDTASGSFTSSLGGATTVACNVTPASREVRELHEDRAGSRATHVIRFPYDATVPSGSQVTISGTVYDVVGADERMTNRLYLQTYAVELGAV